MKKQGHDRLAAPLARNAFGDTSCVLPLSRGDYTAPRTKCNSENKYFLLEIVMRFHSAHGVRRIPRPEQLPR